METLSSVGFYLFCVLAGVLGAWIMSKMDGRKEKKEEEKEVKNSPLPVVNTMYRPMYDYDDHDQRKTVLAMIDAFLSRFNGYVASFLTEYNPYPEYRQAPGEVLLAIIHTEDFKIVDFLNVMGRIRSGDEKIPPLEFDLHVEFYQGRATHCVRMKVEEFERFLAIITWLDVDIYV